MVVADPASELLGLVRALGDPAPAGPSRAEPSRAEPSRAEPSPADPSPQNLRRFCGEGPDAPPDARRRAELVRRRFGLALPPPFAGLPGAEEPVRPAAAADGAAIAAVKWRAFGSSYRGVLPDAFLDGRDVVPPVSFWTGRAMVPPSRRHRLLVWGRPGVVYGYADAGPAHPEDLRADDPEPASVGEVYELYVDPTVQGRGGGARLYRAVEDHLASVGLGRLELSVLVANRRARSFYEACGMRASDRVRHVDLGTVAFDEVRYVRVADGDRS